MLDIKILGTGCADCLKLEQQVIHSLQYLGISDAKVELVTDEHLIEYGLRGDQAPGLLINGMLAWAGSLPREDQITDWLRQVLTAHMA